LKELVSVGAGTDGASAELGAGTDGASAELTDASIKMLLSLSWVNFNSGPCVKIFNQLG